MVNLKTTVFDKKRKFVDFSLKFIIYLSAILSCSVLILILFFILAKGLPGINFKFLASAYSGNSTRISGIFPVIVNTVYVLVLTLLLDMIFGVSMAIYMFEYVKNELFLRIIRFFLDVVSGLPSIIFGIFGHYLFCIKFGIGTSILSGCLTLALYTFPIVVRTTEEALKSVPKTHIEAAVALGAKNMTIIYDIKLRYAIPGIFTSATLCISKILGESAALIYTIGMAYNMPKGLVSHLFSGGRTLTLHLYQIAKQANSPDSLSIVFATAAVILILELILILFFDLISYLIKNR
ncbi:MAG: phosphate ABC transporter permease PstA [Oscillospiraceae bacterium]|nr:phosphate ABC transporter permease PstA [Oscillospiraceae bacterium]